MRLFAQTIESQLYEFYQRRLNGIIDLQGYICALNKTIAASGMKIPKEDIDEINSLWYQIRWGHISTAIPQVAKNKDDSLEEKRAYVRRVMGIAYPKIVQSQNAMLLILQKHAILINSFLEPYKEILKQEIQEELMEDSILGFVK